MKNKGITLVSLVITIIVLLILAGVSVVMLFGENSILGNAEKAREETQIRKYEEIINLAVTEANIVTEEIEDKEILKKVRTILEKDEEFKEATITGPDENEEKLRLIVVTKEGYVYYVYGDRIEFATKKDEFGNLELDINLENGDIKYTYYYGDSEEIIEDGKWTNGNVRVKIEVVNEKYKAYQIEYSYDMINWTAYKEEFMVTENNTQIYTRLTNGIAVTGSYATGNVTCIDRLEPKEFEPEATSTTNSIIVTAETTDQEATETDGCSGIEGYRFSKDNGETWTEYQESGEYIFDNLTQTTEYTITVEAIDKAGNITEGEISKATGTVEGLIEANTTFTSEPNTWTNETVKVTASTEITGYTLQTSKDAVDWMNTESQEFTDNGIMYARLVDSTGQSTGYAMFIIENIDKLEPNEFTPSAESTTSSITVIAETTDKEKIDTDGCSGIAGYRFSNDNGETWTEYQASGTYTWEDLPQTTEYQIKVEAKDNAGNSIVGMVIKSTDSIGAASGGSYTPTTWTNGDVTVTLPTTEGFDTRYTTDGTQPTNTSTKYSNTFTVSGNCTINYIYADETNIGGAGTLNVTNIDKTVPTINTDLSSSSVTTKGFTLNVTVTDSSSGLSKIIWYYKKSSASSYSSKTTTYTTMNGSTAGAKTKVTKTKAITSLTSGTYNAYAEIYDVAGNKKTTSTINITLGTIATASGGSYTPTTWTNGNVTVTLPTKSGFTTRYTTNGTAPTKTSTAYSSAFTVSSNCTINYIYTDGTNIGGAGTLNVTNIDKTVPTINTDLSSSSITTKGFTLNVTLTDSLSGLSKITWYYKKSTASSYSSTTTTYTTMNGSTAGTKTKVTKSKAITSLTSGTYSAYAVIYDVAGNKKTSSTISITTNTVTSGTTSGAITFSTPTWSSKKASTTISTNTSYSIQYQVNSTTGTWTTGTSVTGLLHGDKVYARLWDGTNGGEHATLNVLDETKPSSPTITVTSGTLGSNSYYTSASVTVKITAGSDSQSGVNKTTYVLSGATTKSETTITSGGTFTITANGSTKITAYTYDVAGNKSTAATKTIKIDNVAPSAPTVQTLYKVLAKGTNQEITYAQSNYSKFTLSSGNFLCTNNGDANIIFGINNKLTGIKGAVVSLADLTANTNIQVYYNKAGENSSSANSVSRTVGTGSAYALMTFTQANYATIRVDIGSSTQSYTIGAIDLLASNGLTHNNFVRSLLSNSDTSGSTFWKYQYSKDDKTWTDLSSVQVTNSSGKVYAIQTFTADAKMYYRVVDKAGNASASKSFVAYID